MSQGDSLARASVDVILQRRDFKGWEAWSITRGSLEVVLVPQVGGRIMGLLWRGQDLLFTQAEREGVVPDLDPRNDVREQKRALGFPLWGGDKTWIAPQSEWPGGMPYLDLDSGPYDFQVLRNDQREVSVSMTSRLCRETGLRLRRTITVAAGRDELLVRHEMENATSRPVRAELWDVTMVKSPGVTFLPTWANSAYPDGVRTYVAEGQSAHVRPTVVRANGNYATVSCREQIAFKFGSDGPEGWIAAVLEQNHGALVGYRKSVPTFADRPYAHGCVAEVYKSDAYEYLELELHGPTVTLAPGEHFGIDEHQVVADVDEWPRTEAMARAIARY